jgi:3-methyladenine DNA glycosylase AlkC
MENTITSPLGEQFQIKAGEPLKNMLNHESLRKGAWFIQSVYNPFQVDEFIKSTMDKTWDSLELKARGRQITVNMKKYLPPDYSEALDIIDKVVAKYAAEITILGFSFPDFVEIFGQDEANWDLSVNALERYTTYWSSEMAVRQFIINDEKRMMAQMYAWSKHENEHVRRLSSEGCRPALPWAQALNSFKKDPAPVLPILEQLKTDPSMYVRKSVANNLNDISKTHPDLVAKIAKDWYGKNEHTNWIVKHACRTLLKKGNRDVLALFGLDSANIDVDAFALNAKSISIGEDVTFSFSILSKETTKVRLEYGIDFVKANGKRNRKIFQISEVSLKANEKKPYTKNHSFADVSTRKHYAGTHSITLIVNGVEQGILDFELKA